MNDTARPRRENNYILLAVLGLSLFLLAGINLWAATVIGESCGALHPLLFEIDIDYIDEANDRVSLIEASLPFTPQPTDTDREELPHDWESCVQYWGYAGNNEFSLNAYGVNELAYDALMEYDDEAEPSGTNIKASVVLSELGTVVLYLLMPSLVILMPLATLSSIHRDKSWLWIILGALVAAQALSSSLLYIHFSGVSGITALAEFGYGIFGGTTTGTAIAFMGKMLDIFRDN